MYLISNQERRDIIRMLETLRAILEVGKSLRRANMVRVAGLLIGQLERKEEIHNNIVKALKDEHKRNNSAADR